MVRNNIFFIIESSFPEYTGGIENWLWNVSVRLADKFNVYIISESPSIYREPFYSIPSSIRILRYPTWRRNPIIRFLLRGKLRKFEILYHSQSINKILKANVQDPSSSILFALGTITPSSASLQYKKTDSDILYVSSSRGPHAQVEANAIPSLKKYFFNEEKKNMVNADIVLVNGYDTLKYYESFGIKGEVLLNGVDVTKLETLKENNPYDENSKVIVSVGSLLDIKGVNELIKAFSFVKPVIKDVKLYFVGKGDSTKYQRLANALGVAKDIVFVGNKNNVAPYLQYANIAACLSGGGGFSMAALEAMASKTPIIAWDTDVYRQFNSTAHTMELVEYNNVERLGQKIREMLLDLPKYKKMGVDANNYARQFDWKNVITNMINILENK